MGGPVIGSPTYEDRPPLAHRAWDRSATGLNRWRRSLQITLGLIWLLDAGLQFQPFRFGKNLVTAFLVGTQAGTPQMVKSPMGWVAHLVLRNPRSSTPMFALIQLSLAIGMLWRPMAKRALTASLLWSLAVRWFAEGTGGVFRGGTRSWAIPARCFCTL